MVFRIIVMVAVLAFFIGLFIPDVDHVDFFLFLPGLHLYLLLILRLAFAEPKEFVMFFVVGAAGRRIRACAPTVILVPIVNVALGIIIRFLIGIDLVTVIDFRPRISVLHAFATS